MESNLPKGKLISTVEAAQRLGITLPTLRNFIKAGRLTGFATRTGGRITWVTTASLQELIGTFENK